MELNITEFIKRETSISNVNTSQIFTERKLNILIYKAINEQLILNGVVSTSCGKCDNTGVLWSKDRLSAKTCGCK